MKKLLPIFVSSLIALSANAVTIPETQTFTGTESYTEKLTVNAYVVYTIGTESNKSSLTVSTSSQPLTNNGRIVITSGSKFIVESTVALASTDWRDTTTSGKVDVYGEYQINHTGGGNAFVGTVGTSKTVNVFSGGKLVVTGVGGGGFDVQNGTLNLKSGSTVDISSTIIYHRGDKGTTKTIIEDNVTFSKGVSFITGQNCVSTIDLSNRTQNITFGILQLKNGSKTTLILSEASIITKLSTAGNYVGTEELILKDFKNDIVKLTNTSELSIVDKNYISIKGQKVKLSAFDESDKEITLGANDYWEITTGGYLNLIQAVPEPAEWAMILGSLALGLAIYRRRK